MVIHIIISFSSNIVVLIVLDITVHGELYIASKPVSVHWRDLGARLGVLQTTLATIEADCNGKVEKCMSTMLEKWLRRAFGEVRDDVKPTWKSVCVALSHIDRALAERLAVEHDCGDISVSGWYIASVNIDTFFLVQLVSHSQTHYNSSKDKSLGISYTTTFLSTTGCLV